MSYDITLVFADSLETINSNTRTLASNFGWEKDGNAEEHHFILSHNPPCLTALENKGINIPVSLYKPMVPWTLQAELASHTKKLKQS